MRFALLLSFSFICTCITAQEYIWGGPGFPNTEFDGGLHDWTTYGYSYGVAHDEVVFYWDDDGNANKGAYASHTEPINSISVGNGAAAFDSDFLDSNGQEVGKGEVPGEHQVYLESPVINLVGHDAITLKFNQSYRKYKGSTHLEVTNNNGESWTSFILNESIGKGEKTNSSAVSLIDISSVAANQEEVRFRFVFHGEYYFWVIDDVALIRTPESDLAIGDYYYPMNARSTPRAALDSDTMRFWCDVSNLIGESASGMAKAQITNQDASEILWETTKPFSNLKKDSTKRVYFDDVVIPWDKFFLFEQEGEYQIIYEVINDSEDEEINLSNNKLTNIIRVNNHETTCCTIAEYSLNEGTVGVGGNSEFTILNLYKTGSLPNDAMWIAHDLTTGLSIEKGDRISCKYIAGIWKIDDSVDDDLSQLLDGDPIDNNPFLTNVGYGYGELKDHEVNQDFKLESGLLNSETDEPGVLFDANTRYLVSMEYKDVDFDAIGSILPHVGTSIKYFQPVTFIADDDGIYKLSNKSWAWKLILESIISEIIIISTEDKSPILNASIQVFPNPATNFIQVDFDVKRVEDTIDVVIHDVTGKVIRQITRNNVSSDRIDIDVSNFEPGQYSVLLLTSKGYQTTQFTIVR